MTRSGRSHPETRVIRPLAPERPVAIVIGDDDPATTSEAAAPFVSVIVPVFKDGTRLVDCLDALERQTYDPSGYEVIVVDNGRVPTVELPAGRFPHARVIHEPAPGSYAARNRGLEAARGERLAFTDSDCRPHPDWLASGIAHLDANPGTGLVAGRIDVFAADETRPNAVELHDMVTAFRQHEYVARGYGATANVLTTRGVFDEVGRFDPSLKSGGDREWGRRVSAHGLPVVYAPEMRVAHPARRTLGELRRKKVRVIGGEYAIMRSGPRERTRFALKLLRNLVPPSRHLVGVTRDRRLRGLGQRARVGLILIFAHYIQAAERIRLVLGGNPTR